MNRRTRRELDLDAEIQAHLQLAAQDRVRNGEAPEAAAFAARREFGNATLVKEMARDAWAWTWLESLVQDVRYAIRTLGKTPAFTATAIAALALGIGANTAIFSLVNAILLTPLDAPDPDRIVTFANVAGDEFDAVSPAKFNVWRRQTNLFQDVSAYRISVVNLTAAAYPEQVQEMKASAGFFHLFGNPIAQGRGFTADEDRPNGDRVVVLSNTFWKQHFAGDPAIIGKTMSLGGLAWRIVGITTAGFRDESDPPPAVYVPFQIDPASIDDDNSFQVSARLKPGITISAARAQLKVVGEEFRRKFPGALEPEESFGTMPLKDDLVSDSKTPLFILQGAVVFVLLIACANVANLLLVRATGRQREIAIRAAIGADRGRIARQLLTESLVISSASCACGLALGYVAIRAVLAANPGDLARLGTHGSSVTLDGKVLAFTLGLSLIAGVLFGLIPACQVSRANLSSHLKEGSGRSGTGFRQSRTRALLTVSEMALALALLIGAGLLIRSFAALRSVKPGFETHNVLTMRMSLTEPRFAKTIAVANLIRDGIRRVGALPGVAAVGAACCLPIEDTLDLPFIIAGRPLNGPAHGEVYWTPISTGYFDAFRIPVVRGRTFTDRDRGGSSGVVIVNQAMAKMFWPKSDPLTGRLIIGTKGAGARYDEPPRQIIGIVGDTRENALDEAPRPAVYVPEAQITNALNVDIAGLTPLAWIVRTQVEPHALSAAIQNELRLASGGLPVARVRSMDDILIQSTARQNFGALLLTIFAAAALVLAAIGIYGSMAYSVQQQKQEIGIRLALGAEPGKLRNRVVSQGTRLASIGAAIGLAVAFGLSRILASLLFGVQPRDPVVFSIAPALLLAVALAAVWLPARRASRINAADAIRYE